MAENLKWDISRISDLLAKLRDNTAELKSSRDLLVNINSVVEKAWKGKAGSEFDRRMDIDAENLDKLIKGAEELCDDLTKALSEGYENTENDIKNEIDRLARAVSK